MSNRMQYTKKIPSTNHMLKTTFLFIATVCITIAVINNFNGRADAVIDNGSGIPSSLQSYSYGGTDRWANFRCWNINDSVDFIFKTQAWISELGNSSSLGPLLIDEGQDTINLQLNVLATQCTTNMNTPALLPGQPFDSNGYFGTPPRADSVVIEPRQAIAQSNNIGNVRANIDTIGAINNNSISWGAGYLSNNSNPYNTRIDLSWYNSWNCGGIPQNVRFYVKSSCDPNAPVVNTPIRISDPAIANLTANSDGTSRTYRIVVSSYGVAVVQYNPIYRPGFPDTYSCITNRVTATGLGDVTNCGGSDVDFIAEVTVRSVGIRGCTDPLSPNYNPAATIDDGSCIIPSLVCPTFMNPLVNVALAGEAAGPGPASYGPSGGRHTQNVPYSYWVVTAVNDISSGGTRVPTITSIPGIGRSTTSPSVVLNYTPYEARYPYDPNQASVSYSQGYNVYTYTYNGGAVYAPDVWVDANGNGIRDPGEVTAGALLGYAPTGPSIGPNQLYAARTTDATIMPPCYNRRFTTSIVATGGARLLDSNEDPNRTDFDVSLRVDFTVLGPTTATSGLRNASRVNSLPYTIEYTTRGISSPTTVSGSFSRTVTVTASTDSKTGNGTAALSETIPLVVPRNGGLQAGDQVCWTITVGRYKGTIRSTSTLGDIISSEGPPRSQEFCTAYMEDIPYARFYSADVFAGGEFEPNCVPPYTTANALGNMRGSPPGTSRGTGAELAIFAAGAITGIQPLSKQVRNPSELGFANVAMVNLPGYQFGGGFGPRSCVVDYFENVANIPAPTIRNGLVDINNLGTPNLDDIYYLTSGSGTVRLCGQLTPRIIDGSGKRVAIYVRGNVLIRSNGCGPPSGRFGYAGDSWVGQASIPSLTIIADGDIYIDSGITNLDGTYVALGKINTCSIPSQQDLLAPIDTAAITGRCRENKLQVNGAFIANEVNLLRSFGSLRDGRPQETPDPTNAAESFIYDPTVWLTNGGGVIPRRDLITIDSIVSLPPAF